MEEPQGLQLTFNIRSDAGKLKVVDNTTPAKKEEPQEEISKTPDEEIGDNFDLELINRDRLKEEELVDLGQRISLYVRDLLSKKKIGILRIFMDKTKHHMGNAIMDLAKDEIEEYKKNGK